MEAVAGMEAEEAVRGKGAVPGIEAVVGAETEAVMEAVMEAVRRMCLEMECVAATDCHCVAILALDAGRWDMELVAAWGLGTVGSRAALAECLSFWRKARRPWH